MVVVSCHLRRCPAYEYMHGPIVSLLSGKLCPVLPSAAAIICRLAAVLSLYNSIASVLYIRSGWPASSWNKGIKAAGRMML